MSDTHKGIKEDTKRLIGRTTWSTDDTPRNFATAFVPDQYDQPEGTKFLAKGERPLSPIFNRALVALGKYIDAAKAATVLPDFEPIWIKVKVSMWAQGTQAQIDFDPTAYSDDIPIIRYLDFEDTELAYTDGSLGDAWLSSAAVTNYILSETINLNAATRHSVTLNGVYTNILPGMLVKLTSTNFTEWLLITGVATDTTSSTTTVTLGLPVEITDASDPAVSYEAIQNAIYNPSLSNWVTTYDESFSGDITVEVWPSYFGPADLIDFSKFGAELITEPAEDQTVSDCLLKILGIPSTSNLLGYGHAAHLDDNPTTAVSKLLGYAPKWQLQDNALPITIVDGSNFQTQGLFKTKAPFVESTAYSTIIKGPNDVNIQYSLDVTVAAVTTGSGYVQYTLTFSVPQVDLLYYKGAQVLLEINGISVLGLLRSYTSTPNIDVITRNTTDVFSVGDKGTAKIFSNLHATEQYLFANSVSAAESFIKTLETSIGLINSIYANKLSTVDATVTNNLSVSNTITADTINVSSKLTFPNTIGSQLVIKPGSLTYSRGIYFQDISGFTDNRRLLFNAADIRDIYNISVAKLNIKAIDSLSTLSIKAGTCSEDPTYPTSLTVGTSAIIASYNSLYVKWIYPHNTLSINITTDSSSGWSTSSEGVYTYSAVSTSTMQAMVNAFNTWSGKGDLIIDSLLNSSVTLEDFFGSSFPIQLNCNGGYLIHTGTSTTGSHTSLQLDAQEVFDFTNLNKPSLFVTADPDQDLPTGSAYIYFEFDSYVIGSDVEAK